MTPRLIALDIDGTLIKPRAHYSDLPAADMTAAIKALDEAGITMLLATGRMFPGTQRVAQHLGLTTPLVCQQGAALHQNDGQVLQQFAIDPDIALELVQFAREGGWPYSWFDAQRYLVSEPNEPATFFANVSGVEVEYDTLPEHSGVMPTGVDIISDPQHASEIHATLQAKYGERVEMLDFTSVTAFHSPLSRKGNAVALMAAELGIAQADVLAIGDSANDASMLNWAGHGATPAHCDSYARAAADEVLAGDGVDGVCALLNSVLEKVRAA